MTDMLSNAISGLMASQIALNTTSNNVSNATTPGYSRQRVSFASRDPQLLGGFYVGSGTQVTSIARVYNQYLTDQVRSATSSQARLSSLSDLASRVDNLFVENNASLQPALDSFFSGVQDVANDPASTAAREALLGQSNALVDRFHTLSAQLTQYNTEVNQRISADVTQINTLSQGIANLNAQIQTTSANIGSQPNELLDQRDELIRQLSTVVGVSISQQGDGSISVFAGNGQPLVLGRQANTLSVGRNIYDPSRYEVTSSSGSVVTNQLSGGDLGGILDFRSNMLDSARNSLGRTAIGLAVAFNQQHRDGMDLNGDLGGDFFSLGEPAVFSSGNNTGSADVSANISDISQLTASDYKLTYSGTSWSLARSDGTAVTMTGTGTALDPFVAEGLNFTVAGTADAGDSFLIQPTRSGADDIEMAISDTNEIAAAAPLRSSTASTNTGNVSISKVAVVDVGDANLMTPVAIVFTSATTFTANGVGYTYVDGMELSVNGWTVTLTGVPPDTGDSFSVDSNAGAVGDNTNALALGALSDTGILDNGATTVGGAYGQMVAAVGATTAQANVSLDAQNTLLTQAQQAQQSVSGVNLDEEAANLTIYQQSYEASAQMISIAEELFQTLMSVVQG